ncbi:MAG: hypothetical protein KAR00_03015 [Candidatus Pacebacteria bacterium]|nr:hypothetical protein [Candidatus Paceibacterota bacterium]
MPNILEHLKAKPESVRKRIAIITAVVLTGVIVFVWLTILYTRSLRIDKGVEQSAASSPLNIFFDEM